MLRDPSKPKQRHPKCGKPTCKRPAPWTCRKCGRRTCEQHCNNKVADGSALCGRCWHN